MSYYNTDKNNPKNNPAYYNGNPNGYNGEPNIRDYEMVIPSSEEYRLYTWNEYARGNVRNIMSEEEFGKKYPNEQKAPLTERAPEQRKPERVKEDKRYNPRNYKNNDDMNDSTYAGEVAIDAKKKNKVMLLAYIFILAIIILVVVISATSNKGAFASGGDSDTTNGGATDTTGDHFSDSYYSDKTQIRFTEADAGEYLVVSKNTDKEKKTNWFDAFCDKIEAIVGG